MKNVIWLLLTIATLLSQEYDRSSWGQWIDVDKDGQNTRAEVLIEETDSSKLKIVDGKIVSGEWICPYTGKVITEPSKIDIDHVVPLAEAHASGASEWSKEKKIKYFNYLDRKHHLVASSISANRAKGSNDPSKWMPEVNGCDYLAKWVFIKYEWGLTMDSVESKFIYDYFEDNCFYE